jgi:hypothetical protein
VWFQPGRAAFSCLMLNSCANCLHFDPIAHVAGLLRWTPGPARVRDPAVCILRCVVPRRLFNFWGCFVCRGCQEWCVVFHPQASSIFLCRFVSCICRLTSDI